MDLEILNQIDKPVISNDYFSFNYLDFTLDGWQDVDGIDNVNTVPTERMANFILRRAKDYNFIKTIHDYRFFTELMYKFHRAGINNENESVLEQLHFMYTDFNIHFKRKGFKSLNNDDVILRCLSFIRNSYETIDNETFIGWIDDTTFVLASVTYGGDSLPF